MDAFRLARLIVASSILSLLLASSAWSQSSQSAQPDANGEYGGYGSYGSYGQSKPKMVPSQTGPSPKGAIADFYPSFRPTSNPMSSPHYPNPSPNFTDHAICKSYQLDVDEKLGEWIAAQIPQVITPGCWGNNNGTWGGISYYAPKKLLIIYHTPAMHAEVEQFIRCVTAASGQTTKSDGIAFACGEKFGAAATQCVNPGAALGTGELRPTPKLADRNVGTGYPIPQAVQPPKHLFHVIANVNGNSGECNMAELLRKLVAGDDSANDKKVSPTPSPSAPGQQNCQLIVRYEGEGIIDDNVVKVLHTYLNTVAKANPTTSSNEPAIEFNFDFGSMFGRRKPKMSVEEERLQWFWHDYYQALQTYYAGIADIDWIAYYKNHGQQINVPDGPSSRIQFAPVIPQPSWIGSPGAVPQMKSGPPEARPVGSSKVGGAGYGLPPPQTFGSFDGSPSKQVGTPDSPYPIIAPWSRPATEGTAKGPLVGGSLLSQPSPLQFSTPGFALTTLQEAPFWSSVLNHMLPACSGENQPMTAPIRVYSTSPPLVPGPIQVPPPPPHEGSR